MAERVIVDTSVFVAALLSARGGSREVVRLCLLGIYVPVMGEKLFAEYEDVLGRDEKFNACPLSSEERAALLDAFSSVCEWTRVFYLWRPNLTDEGDNHLVELGVAGGATSLITNNPKDFRSGEIRFPQMRIETPSDILKRRKATDGDDDDPDS